MAEERTEGPWELWARLDHEREERSAKGYLLRDDWHESEEKEGFMEFEVWMSPPGMGHGLPQVIRNMIEIVNETAPSDDLKIPEELETSRGYHSFQVEKGLLKTIQAKLAAERAAKEPVMAR